MYFKLFATLKNLNLGSEKINIEITHERNPVAIELKKLDKNETQLDKQADSICTAIIEIKLDEGFEYKLKKATDEISDDINLSLLTIKTRLSKIIDTTISNYRWAFGIENSYSPILSQYGLWWSFDNINWFHQKANDVRLVIK
jgi:hypothetical protein